MPVQRTESILLCATLGASKQLTETRAPHVKLQGVVPTAHRAEQKARRANMQHMHATQPPTLCTSLSFEYRNDLMYVTPFGDLTSNVYSTWLSVASCVGHGWTSSAKTHGRLSGRTVRVCRMFTMLMMHVLDFKTTKSQPRKKSEKKQRKQRKGGELQHIEWLTRIVHKTCTRVVIHNWLSRVGAKARATVEAIGYISDARCVDLICRWRWRG
jgi:hypothetical protein